MLDEAKCVAYATRTVGSSGYNDGTFPYTAQVGIVGVLPRRHGMHFIHLTARSAYAPISRIGATSRSLRIEPFVSTTVSPALRDGQS